MIEIKSNFQKNKEYDELDRFFKLPFSIPQCHQNNKNAHKRKADTNATFTEFSDFRHFERSCISPNLNLKFHAILLTISDISMNCLLTKFTIFKVK